MSSTFHGNKSVVIEFGTTFLRGGISGMHCPRFITDSKGLLEIEDESLLANKICELFQEMFTEKLCIKAKEYSVLIIEKITLRHSFSDVLLTVLLKVFQVISVSIQPDLFLAGLSSGVSTGIVLSIGEDESQAICIAQGRPMLQTFRTSSVGVTNAIKSFNHLLKDELEGLEILMKMLDIDGDGNLSEEELDMAVEATRPLFEKVACCNLRGKTCQNITVHPSENVANDVITIQSKYRHLPLESIIIGESDAEGCLDERGGAAGLLLDCLAACNMDVRAIACKHIVICGGGAMIPGLCDAICDRASQWATSEVPDGVVGSSSTSRGLNNVVKTLSGGALTPLPSPFIRSSLSWIGGSIFASINSNYQRFLKLQDLENRVREGGTRGNGYCFFLSPDWRSLDNRQWQFWGPVIAGPEELACAGGTASIASDISFLNTSAASASSLGMSFSRIDGDEVNDSKSNFSFRGQLKSIRSASDLWVETGDKSNSHYALPKTPKGFNVVPNL